MRRILAAAYPLVALGALVGALLGLPLAGGVGSLVGAIAGAAAGWTTRNLIIALSQGMRTGAGLGQLSMDERLEEVAAVCSTDARRELADHYRIADRMYQQYEPPSEERLKLEEVSRLYRQRRTSDAEARMRSLLEDYPDSPYIAARHVRRLLQELRIEEAETTLDPALRKNPDEISLLILSDGIAAVRRLEDQPAQVQVAQAALARLVDWAGIQLDLVVRETKRAKRPESS